MISSLHKFLKAGLDPGLFALLGDIELRYAAFRGPRINSVLVDDNRFAVVTFEQGNPLPTFLFQLTGSDLAFFNRFGDLRGRWGQCYCGVWFGTSRWG